MPESVATSSAGESWQDRLTAKVGPLPVWAWAALILAALLAWMYFGKWGFFGGGLPAPSPTTADGSNLGDYAGRGPGGAGDGSPVYSQPQPLAGGSDYFGAGSRVGGDSTASAAPSAYGGTVYGSGTSAGYSNNWASKTAGATAAIAKLKGGGGSGLANKIQSAVAGITGHSGTKA